MEMRQKLKELLSYLDITPSVFADSLQVQRSAISHLLSGRNKPGYDLLRKIVTIYPQINLEWLILDKKPMIKPLNNLQNSIVEESKNSIVVEEMPNLFATPNENIEKKLPKEENVEMKTNNINGNKREVEKIVFFYKDGSFKIYE